MDEAIESVLLWQDYARRAHVCAAEHLAGGRLLRAKQWQEAGASDYASMWAELEALLEGSANNGD
jgi:hypothetical protein